MPRLSAHDSRGSPAAEPVFGVLSYQNDSIQRASGNIGDSIQSLAALNCYRHALGLGMPFAEFLGRVLTDTVPGARFVFVSRDCSSRQSLPPHVITLMNGWFMDAGRNGVFEWPMHESVEPVFVSFHLADDRLLTPAGVEYLRRYEPIGCRDVATVEALTSKGINAYFSGCLTLTMDFLPWTGGSSDELFVDVAREGRQTIKHWDPTLKNRDPKALLKRAYALLKRYSTAAKVTTSRLHCFLPCVAMGVPVTLTGVDRNDPRLRGIDAWDFASIRHGLACDAANRLHRILPSPGARRKPTFDICFAFDDAMASHVAVAMHSIVLNNRHARIRFHLIQMDDATTPTMDGAEVLTYVAGWNRPYRGLAHVSRATMLRLLAPELIREDLRLLYLDVDVVVNMNLEPMLSVDPGHTGIAMKSVEVTRDFFNGGLADAETSRPDYDWSRSGDTGVMVMQLDTLRHNGFTRFCIDYPAAVNERLLINLYCRGEYTELRREWNLSARQDSAIVGDTDQYILHYSGPGKPWSLQKPHHWQLWNWYSRRLRERERILGQACVIDSSSNARLASG